MNRDYSVLKGVMNLTTDSYAIRVGTTEIGESAFVNCEDLREVFIPESVTCIGANAFKGLVLLERVIIADNSELIAIDESSFEGCCRLKSIKLPSELQAIETKAFMGSGLESIIIPDQIFSIAPYSFAYCLELREVLAPKGLSDLSLKAFDGCERLEIINFKTT